MTKTTSPIQRTRLIWNLMLPDSLPRSEANGRTQRLHKLRDYLKK